MTAIGTPYRHKKAYICKICGASLFRLQQTQKQHLKTHMLKVKSDTGNEISRFFRAPFADEF